MKSMSALYKLLIYIMFWSLLLYFNQYSTVMVIFPESWRATLIFYTGKRLVSHMQ